MGPDKTNEVNTEKRMNLLIVLSTLYLGGAQKVACILANGLSERHNVTIAYCFDSGRVLPFSEKCSFRKLPDYNKNAGLPIKARFILKQIRELKALKKELNIDVSVSLGNVSNLINVMSKSKDCIICSERSNPEKSWGRLYFLTKLSYRKADHIIFQSEQIRSLFGERICRKSSILKNPIMIPALASERRAKKIVSLGRLEAQKNHSLLIRSFARFYEQFPEYSLHIFGEGKLKNGLQQLIASLGMSDHIILEGNDPAVLEHIRDAEMFVLSSDFEGLSNALLECMAMGIACISTKCEGSVDVIRSGKNGLLVDIGDEGALTRALCALAADPGLRRQLEQQAREDMKAFDRSVVVDDWERVIRACL